MVLFSLLLCGLFFPLLVTGLAQTLMPYQANGELVQAHGSVVGSALIAQEFTLPAFFHTRNNSASGVDPDITVQDAYSQIPRVHGATGIPSSALEALVDQHSEDALGLSGSRYVNVLALNLALVRSFPSAYSEFAG